MTEQELLKNASNHWGRLLSPTEIEGIRKLINEDNYAVELVDEAIRIAGINGKCFVNYVAGILRRMKSRGLNTLEQVRKSEEKRKNELTPKVELTADFIQMLIYAAELWATDEVNSYNIPYLKEQLERLA